MLGGQASHAFIVSWLSPVSLEAAARLQGPVSPATTTNHEAEDDFPGAWTSPSRNLMDLSQYSTSGGTWVACCPMCSVRWRWLGDTTDTCGRIVGEQVSQVIWRAKA